MGGFADVHIEQLREPELEEFERLMELPDQQVLSWLTGEAAVPSNYDGPLFRRLRAFRAGNGA